MSDVATATRNAINLNLQGGYVTHHQFSFDPASLAAAAKISDTVAVAGVKVGDVAFVNAQNLPAMLVVTGAKVTATDVVTVYLQNVYDATTAVDSGAITLDLMVLHLS